MTSGAVIIEPCSLLHIFIDYQNMTIYNCLKTKDIESGYCGASHGVTQYMIQVAYGKKMYSKHSKAEKCLYLRTYSLQK